MDCIWVSSGKRLPKSCANDSACAASPAIAKASAASISTAWLVGFIFKASPAARRASVALPNAASRSAAFSCHIAPASLLSARTAESTARWVSSRALRRWPAYASVSDASESPKLSYSGLPANHATRCAVAHHPVFALAPVAEPVAPRRSAARRAGSCRDSRREPHCRARAGGLGESPRQPSHIVLPPHKRWPRRGRPCNLGDSFRSALET